MLLVAVREADVLLGFGGVVEKAVFDCALGDLDGDAVGAHVLHFSHDAELLQRDASGHDGVVAVDGRAKLGLNYDVLVVGNQWYRQTLLGHFQHARVGVAAEVWLLLEPSENADPIQQEDWVSKMFEMSPEAGNALTNTL